MQEPDTFQRWMKQLRASLDLTQERLAAEVGCAAYTIRTVERGTRRPSRELAERLAEVLQVAPEQRAAFLRLARSPVSHAPATPTTRDARRLPEPGEGAPGADAPSSASLAPEQAPTDRTATLQTSPILATKLYVPRPRAALVPRLRLLTRLEAGLRGSLTLIAAPPGFGKTTLLADWLNQPTAPSRHMAWLTLDAGDSNPIQFLRYLIATLQTIAPNIGVPTVTLIRAAQPPSIETLLPFLLNDLVQLPDRSILVLDDYHVIAAPAVHQALAFLLDHLPPQLHVVIASRTDPPLPLARYRVRGQVNELRAHDLRFSAEEAATFLQEVMGLPLAPDHVTALEARTEGWIAGLQLAALSLQGRRDAELVGFIDAFTGSHRFVVDYLVDEVLARQPAHVQTFLLQTSILERLSGPLCDAVVLGNGAETQQASATPHHAYSQVLLEQLERANLFIVPLDEARRWYRYHHLFAQVLRERLAAFARPDLVKALNHRAVAWLEQEGLLDDAVRQAFASDDRERAIELIERHGMALIERSEHVLVRHWMEQVPLTLVETRPQLAMVAGWLLAFMSRFDELDQLLQKLIHAAGTTPAGMDIRGEIAVLRASSAYFQSQYAAAFELANEALRLLPVDLPAKRARALTIVGMCFMHRGEVVESEAALGEAAVLAMSGNDPATTLLAWEMLATLYDRQGRLDDKVRTYEQAIRAGEDVHGTPLPLLGAAWVGIGEVWYERNRLEHAQPHVVEGLKLLNGSIQHYVVGIGYVTLAGIYQARNEGDAALAALEEAEAWAARMHIDSWRFRGLLAAYRVRIWLRQGNLAAALQWAATCGLDDELRLSDVRRFTLIRVRLAEYRETRDNGLLHELGDALARLLTMAETQGWERVRIELLILQALVRQAQGDMGQAMDILGRALTLAAPEGYVRIFVDEGPPMGELLRATQRTAIAPAYVSMLVAAFRSNAEPPVRRSMGLALPLPNPPSSSDSLIEPLTSRELEVLRLLAAGHSNQAIAQELIVAVGTVKRHVNSVLSKLDAQSRLQAVARARELGLV